MNRFREHAIILRSLNLHMIEAWHESRYNHVNCGFAFISLLESVGENATLYCDSTVTLGQVLDAATDSHVWYFIEKNAAGGYDGNLCCFVGDSVIDFYVTVWFEGENALVQLSNPLLYLASSPSPYDDCYYATSQQGAAFLKWAYTYAAAS